MIASCQAAFTRTQDHAGVQLHRLRAGSYRQLQQQALQRILPEPPARIALAACRSAPECEMRPSRHAMGPIGQDRAGGLKVW